MSDRAGALTRYELRLPEVPGVARFWPGFPETPGIFIMKSPLGFFSVSTGENFLEGGSMVKKSKNKNPPANARDSGSIPGSGRSPREGNGNPLQYSCLGNHMDRGAWQATVYRVTKDMTKKPNKNNNM